MTESEYVGQEVLPPEEYLGPRRYKIQCLCNRCGKTYSYVTTNPAREDPPCPKKRCKEARLNEEIERRARNMAKIIEEQRAPATIGDKVGVKAIDKTAEIVMADYGMTNLQDNLRPGDTMAPKLPGPMQQAADSMFSAPQVKGNSALARRMNARVQRALAGGSQVSVNPNMATPPKINTIGNFQG